MIKRIFEEKKESKRKKLLFSVILISILILIPLGINASEELSNSSTSNDTSEDLKEVFVEELPVEEPDSPEEDLNQTVELNETTDLNETNELNETVNETETLPEEEPLVEPPSQNEISLGIHLEFPEEIVRGETFVVKGIVTNTGKKKVDSALLKWDIPLDFEILSGEKNEVISLKSGDSYASEITLKSSLSTSLGTNSIKLGVRY